MIDPKVATWIKQRVSQNVRHCSDHILRGLVTPPNGRFYRRRWLKMRGIPWNAGIEDYLKLRVGYRLGILKKV